WFYSRSRSIFSSLSLILLVSINTRVCFSAEPGGSRFVPRANEDPFDTASLLLLLLLLFLWLSFMLYEYLGLISGCYAQFDEVRT
ncbi:MAG: hypothetical protein EZS28_053926, partial [Streblomastix strix]